MKSKDFSIYLTVAGFSLFQGCWIKLRIYLGNEKLKIFVGMPITKYKLRFQKSYLQFVGKVKNQIMIFCKLTKKGLISDPFKEMIADPFKEMISDPFIKMKLSLRKFT